MISTPRRLIALLAAALTGVPLAAPAAEAAPASGAGSAVDPVRDHDAHGDVRIFAASKGMSARKRRSIDIHWAEVREKGDGSFRLLVKIKRVARATSTWDQTVTFEYWEAGRRSRDGTSVWFQHKPELGGSAYDFATDTFCAVTDLTRRPRRDILAATVSAAACLPAAGDRVTVQTDTTYLDDFTAPSYSRDRLRFADLLTPS